ncbi:MAG: T9SS type A sorting domain-containing protein, partial [Calditrichota bacterium]
PFNASTTLRWGLPYPAEVRLVIYDLKGNRVAIPINGRFNAGFHETIWNAAGMADGIYFIRLEGGGKALMRRVVLIK